MRSINNLRYTDAGNKWLSQFSAKDANLAQSLLDSLTLVSHSEFERELLKAIEKLADQVIGKIALFSIRELARPIQPFYFQVVACEKNKTVNAVGTTSDLGSEARISSLIRNIAKANPDKFLNHPTVEYMYDQKCKSIFFIDDFIGSGRRSFDFISSFWAEPKIRSWLSFNWINFQIIAYSGTKRGIHYTKLQKSKPSVHVVRNAPTVYDMPWSENEKNQVISLCKSYGYIANKRKKHMWRGYKNGMVFLVFEHGCPNNAPLILWEKGEKWNAVFKDRTINANTKSVFPLEITRGDTIVTLLAVRQNQLAYSGALSRRGDIGRSLLMILALIARGKRKLATLNHATGYSNDELNEFLIRMQKWGFLSIDLKVTSKGHAELKAARRDKVINSKELDKGSDYYYPTQLREAVS